MDNIINKYLNEIGDGDFYGEDPEGNVLEEGITASKITRTKMDKRNAMIGMFAVRTAKKNNDALYTKYASYRSKTLELKKQIMRKYGNLAKKAANKAMR